MLAGGLRQSQPVMPIAQSVLNALHSGDEVLSFRGRLGELRGVAGALAEDAVLVQQSLTDGRVRPIDRFQHPPGDCQRIPAGLGVEFPGSAFQPLANLADGFFVHRLSQLLILLAAKFDQMVHQLCLAPRLAWNPQAAQRRQLHVQVAHLPGTLADSSQQLQQFFLIAVQLWRKFTQQYLKAACSGAEAVYTLGLRFRGKLDQVLLKLLKNHRASLWRDRHKKRIEPGDENTALTGKRQPRKAWLF